MEQRVMTIEQYIKVKLKILGQLHVRLTEEQERHMRSLKTEGDVDRYAHGLIIGKD